LNAIAEKVRKTGVNCSVFQCDVGNQDEVDATHAKIKQKYDFIDIVILNAAVNIKPDMIGSNSAAAIETMNINFFGVLRWIDKVLPDYLKRGEGMIVGISSLADNRGYSVSGTYCPSKAALSIYLEGFRIEASKHNIKVLTVKPGFVKTPMTDKNDFNMPFIISADRAAKYIVRGIQRERKIIQFPFLTVILAKIIGTFPPFLYDYLSKRFSGKMRE
jgi:short-subunit dehydrogenase